MATETAAAPVRIKRKRLNPMRYAIKLIRFADEPYHFLAATILFLHHSVAPVDSVRTNFALPFAAVSFNNNVVTSMS